MTSTFKAIILFGISAFLLIVFFGLQYLEIRCKPAKLAMPKESIENLPMELGKWTGEKSVLEEEIFEAVDAHAIVNRNYKNALGNSISLHMPMFTEHTVFTPHNPRHCYKGGGYEILDDTVIDLPIDAQTPSIKVRFMTLEKGSEHSQILYWYQLGSRVVTDDGGMRRARWEERWKEERSPVVKVLLQTSGKTEIEGETQLRSLAGPIYQWLRTVLASDADPGARVESPSPEPGDQSAETPSPQTLSPETPPAEAPPAETPPTETSPTEPTPPAETPATDNPAGNGEAHNIPVRKPQLWNTQVDVA